MELERASEASQTVLRSYGHYCGARDSLVELQSFVELQSLVELETVLWRYE